MKLNMRSPISRLLVITALTGSPLFWTGCVVGTSNSKDTMTADTSDTESVFEDTHEEQAPVIKPVLKASPALGSVPLDVVFTLDIGDLDPKDFTFHWKWGDGDQRDTAWVEGMNPKSLLTETYQYKYKGGYAAKVTVAWRKNLKIKGEALANIEVIQPSELIFSKPVQLVSAEVVKMGDPVTLTFEISNEGDAVVNPFETGVYLSKDATLDKDDLLVHTIQHDSMGSGLTGVAKITYNVADPLSFNLPQGITDGHYWIFVYIDHKKKVGEFNELNNIRFASSLLEVNQKVAASPDLSISAPVITSTATSYSPGDSVTYELQIKNLGDGEAKNFNFSVFLSKDKKLNYDPSIDPGVIDLDKNDLPVTDAATTTVKNLPGLATLPIFKAMSVPKIPDGTYWLIAQIDSNHKVIETNENNNVEVSPKSITVKLLVKQGIDLALLDMQVQPTGTYLGGKISVNYTVKNIGTKTTPKFPTTIYFCPTPALSKQICIMNKTKFEIPPMAVGQETQSAKQITIANSTPVQKWFIYMQLDPDNTISELNKGNNIKTFPNLLVTATANVDLVAENVAFHPTKVKAGEIIKLSYKLLNKGTSGSGATKTAIVVSQTNQFSVANLKSGANTLLTLNDEAPINPLSTAYRGAKVVVPMGLDHTKKEWFIGVILDANVDEKAESASDKLNNGASAKTKLIVEDAKGGCFEDPADSAGKNNNTLSTASGLKIGINSSLALCDKDDWYTFKVSKGHSIFVTLKSTPLLWTSPIPADLDIDIVAASGKILDSVKSLGLFKKAASLTVPESGDYLVHVYPHVPGAKAHYTLEVKLEGPPKGVDLYGGALTAAPSATFPGGLLKTKLALTNLGDTASKPFVVRYLLSTDPKIDPKDTKLLDVPFAKGLGAAQSLQFNRNLVLPIVSGGKYYVGAIIDAADAIQETDEKNNVVTSNSVQLNSKITCATDSFSGNHTADEAGALQPITKTYDKLNVCPGLEDWFVLDVAQGKALTVTVNWTQIAGHGMIGMQVIDSSKTGVLVGSANPQNTSAKLPYTQIGGKYYIHIYVLPEGGKLANPYDYSLKVEVTEPDPTDVCLTDSFEANNSPQSAKELGCGFANLSLCMGDQDWFFLDMVKDEKMILDFKHPGNAFKLNIYNNPNLKPIQYLSSSGVLTFTAPSTDKFYVEINHKKADSKPAQGFNYTLKVDGGKGIDLLPTLKSVFPSTASQDDDVYVTTRFSNECKTDSTSFHYGYYLSKDFKLDKDDVKLLSKTLDGGLKGKTFKELDDALVIPSDAKPGPYYLVVKADDQDEVAETQELNNTDHKPLNVTKLCLPDALEPNPNPTFAKTLMTGKTADLSVCPYDYDWFSFMATKGETITVTASFDATEGDLNLRMYEVGKFGKMVAGSVTKKTPEQIIYVAPKTTKYFVRVNGFNGASAAYTLYLCKKVGGSCVECTDNAQCKAKAGDFCDPTGKCQSLNCTIGDDNTCDDGNACTKQKCVENVGCKTELLSGGPCDDGDACTLGESCNDKGVCVNTGKQVVKDVKGEIEGRGGEMLRLDNGKVLFAGQADDEKGAIAGRVELYNYAENLWTTALLPDAATEVMLYGAATQTGVDQVLLVGMATSATSTTQRGLFARVGGSDGKVLTMLEVGGANFARVFYDLLPTDAGQLAVVGQTGLTSKSNGRDGLVASLTTDGQVLWSKTLGGAGEDALYSLARASDGTLLIVGVDTDDKGAERGVIAGLDKTGKLLWEPIFPLTSPGMQSRLEAISLGLGGQYVVGGGSDLGQTGGSPPHFQGLVLWMSAKTFATLPVLKANLIIPGATPQDLLFSGKKLSMVSDLKLSLSGAIVAAGWTGAKQKAIGLRDGAVWTIGANKKLLKTFSFGGKADDALLSITLKTGQVLAFGSADIGASSGPRWLRVEISPPKADCDDGNICTSDLCDAKKGCEHKSLPDGEACGIGLSCNAGVCQ